MAWSKYKAVQYGTVFPGSNLTDFPLLVKIAADSDIASECGSGGGIKFTSADGMTDLAFGLYPSSDITSGDIIARVKASPIMSGTTGNPIVRLYYSASESTTEDKAGVMDGNYVLFMPLEEDPSGSAPQMFDWVSETNVGTSSGTMTSEDLIDGVVGKGLDFDSNDAINIPIPSGLAGATAWTLECLAKKSSNSQISGALSVRGGTTSTQLTLLYPFNSATDGARVYPFPTESGGGDRSGAWHYFAVVPTALYVDGISEATTGARTLHASSDNVTIGAWYPGNQHFVGQIDEVKISTATRSADWLAYAYENDFNNSDTVTLGSEQGGGGGARTTKNTRSHPLGVGIGMNWRVSGCV